MLIAFTYILIAILSIIVGASCVIGAYLYLDREKALNENADLRREFKSYEARVFALEKKSARRKKEAARPKRRRSATAKKPAAKKATAPVTKPAPAAEKPRPVPERAPVTLPAAGQTAQ